MRACPSLFTCAWRRPPFWASAGKGGCRCPASAGLASASVCTQAGNAEDQTDTSWCWGVPGARAVSDRLSWR